MVVFVIERARSRYFEGISALTEPSDNRIG